MEQQAVNGQATTIAQGAATTVTARAHSGVLNRILLSGTIVGTVTFYDSSTTAGTAAGNVIFTFGDPTVATYPLVLPIGAIYNRGLTYTYAGTPGLTFIAG